MQIPFLNGMRSRHHETWLSPPIRHSRLGEYDGKSVLPGFFFSTMVFFIIKDYLQVFLITAQPSTRISSYLLVLFIVQCIPNRLMGEISLTTLIFFFISD